MRHYSVSPTTDEVSTTRLTVSLDLTTLLSRLRVPLTAGSTMSFTGSPCDQSTAGRSMAPQCGAAAGQPRELHDFADSGNNATLNDLDVQGWSITEDRQISIS